MQRGNPEGRGRLKYIKCANITCRYVNILRLLPKEEGTKQHAWKSRGHPSGYNPTAEIEHIRALVHDHPSYVDATEEEEYESDATTNILCPLCSSWCVVTASRG